MLVNDGRSSESNFAYYILDYFSRELSEFDYLTGKNLEEATDTTRSDADGECEQ